MEIRTKFCTYQELADALDCSYHHASQVIAKRIIEAFNIDKTRLPKVGSLPIELVEKYFDLSIDINKKD